MMLLKIISFLLKLSKWGLGIGDWGIGPIPNPQSPIPNPPSPYKKIFDFVLKYNYLNIKNKRRKNSQILLIFYL